MNAFSGRLVVPFEELRMTDVDIVGGKNASLGEMISQLAATGVKVPGGFATTAEAFRDFLTHNRLTERINARLASLNTDDVKALAEAGAEIRGWVRDAGFPPDLEKAIRDNFARLTEGAPEGISFAVRSSATAEDLPDASFAGQQETVLNVVGIDAILDHIREVFASLYNDRAISYRVHKGFAHEGVALSAGIQRMCRSDLGASGVMFTIDTESGFEDVVFITSSWGLGETVVQGAVNPDEFYIHKPMLAGRGPHRAHRRHAARAARALLAFRRRSHRTGPLCHHHRAALWPPDGHRVGQGRHRWPALHPAGPSGNRQIAGQGPQAAALRAQGQLRRADLRPRHRPENRHWPRARGGRRLRDGTRAAR